MNWELYKNRFTKKARSHGLSIDEIEKCLTYSYNLHTQELPVIYDQKHFSLLVGYNLSYIRRASHHTRGFYRTFDIKKKNGDLRRIDEPLPSLKEIQKWILHNILYKIEISAFAKGFHPGRSIRENARFHLGQTRVISLDLKDFFPSVGFGRVYSIFRNIGYSKSVSVLISKLCCLDGFLPQGAPTSPALSNLAARNLDRRLGDYSLKNKFRYTRYADDITISGNIAFPGLIISFASWVVMTEGFRVNGRKTRVMERHERQEVTGVIVNETLNSPIEIRNEIRTALFYIRRYGIESHCEKIEWRGSSRSYSYYLIGRANFARFLSRDEAAYLELKEVLFPHDGT